MKKNIQKELLIVSETLNGTAAISAEKLMSALKVESEMTKRESAVRKMKMLIKSAPITSTDIKAISQHYKVVMLVLEGFSKKNEEELKKPTETKPVLDAFVKKFKSYQISSEKQYQQDIMSLVGEFSKSFYAEREKALPILAAANKIAGKG